MSNKKAKHVIRGDYFPPHFIGLGAILIFFSYLSQVSEYPSFAIWFFIGGVFLSTSRFGTIINTQKRTIKPYLNVLFLRVGFRKKYELLNCFWLSSKRMQDIWHSRGLVQTVTPPYTVVYVYLLTSEGKQYYLFRANSKQAVYERLAKQMQQLGIKCLDRNSV